MDDRRELVSEPMDPNSSQRHSRAHPRRAADTRGRAAHVLVRGRSTAARAVKMIVRSLLVAMLLAPATAAAQTVDDLFNPDVVHRLDLLVNSRDWEKLKADFQLNDYYPADIKWNGLTVHNVGIRSRGLGSRSGVKPALRVDMNRYTTGQQFLGLKSFLLDNLVQDPTGIKELVAMRLYQRMGLPAPREAHVAL